MDIKPGDRVKLKHVSATLPRSSDVDPDDTGMVVSNESLRSKQVRVFWLKSGKHSLHYPFELELLEKETLSESFLLSLLERVLSRLG